VLEYCHGRDPPMRFLGLGAAWCVTTVRRRPFTIPNLPCRCSVWGIIRDRIPGMSSSTEDEFRKTFTAWARRRKAVNADRDTMVAAALAHGISREEIHILTGLGRTTVDRIADKTAGRGTVTTGEDRG
jgi:hypothetical protein